MIKKQPVIKKQPLKTRPVCKVTFEVTPEPAAEAVHLLADFNDWREGPFKRLTNGTWKLTQEVTPDREYEFRYRISSGSTVTYLNDEAADGTTPNDLGTENAIVRC